MGGQAGGQQPGSYCSLAEHFLLSVAYVESQWFVVMSDCFLQGGHVISLVSLALTVEHAPVLCSRLG